MKLIRWIISIIRRLFSREQERRVAIRPHWETHDDGVMVHVRWSLPDELGRYLWVRHYPATPWGLNAAEREAERFNNERRPPVAHL